MEWPFDPLRPFAYGAMIADPPYAYEMRSEKGYGKSPEAHYRTMPEAEIAALPVGQLAGRDCLLWCWSTWPHLEVALRVIKAWGFVYKTGGSWTKLTRTGKRAMGGGYILRSSTEPFLIATIGEPATRSKSVRNLIESERREHSRKPPEARQMVEKLRPDAFAVELFAREPWPGNDVWGLETDRFSVGENAEARGKCGSRLAKALPLVGAPTRLLAGDAVVDAEGGDGQLRLLGCQSAAGGSKGGAVDGDGADLRRDRHGAERLDGGNVIFGSGREGGQQTGNAGYGKKLSHSAQRSGSGG